MQLISLLRSLTAVLILVVGVAEAHAASTAPWTRLAGLPGGGIGHITFDPSNPAIMFAGVNDGGIIFRTTDGGETFSAIKVGTIFQGFRGIAVNPKNSKLVFAISTNNSGSEGIVYRSQDGGLTWAQLSQQPSGLGGGRGLAIDSTGKIIVVADRRGGISYSANLGGSWTNTLPPSSAYIYSLTVDPDNAKVLWAGGYDTANNHAGTLWKSTDFGNSWTKVTVSAFNQSLQPLPQGIAIQPGTGKIIVGWFGSDSSGYVGGVVVSKDGGKTWANSTTGLSMDFVPGNSLVVDPTISTTLYLTTNGIAYPNNLFISTDSGETWKPVGAATGTDSLFTAAARPAGAGLPAAVFAGGLFESTDHGKTWSRKDKGIDKGAPMSVKDDLLNPAGIYAGTYDGLFHSTNNGQTWARVSTWPGATVPRAFDVDHTAAKHFIYVATQTALERSADGGKTWATLALPTTKSTLTYLLSSPDKAGQIYATDSRNTIYKSFNAGTTWTTGTAIGVAGDVFTTASPTIIVDPSSPATFYAAMTSGLWKSTNSGGSWTKTSLSASSGSITSIAATPGAGSGPKLFAATDFGALQDAASGGKTWTKVTPPPTANSFFDLVAAPGKVSNLFAYDFSSNVSARRADGTWGSIDNSIQPFLINAVVSTTSAKIYIGDSGSGAGFVAPLSQLAISGAAVAPFSYRPGANKEIDGRKASLAIIGPASGKVECVYCGSVFKITP